MQPYSRSAFTPWARLAGQTGSLTALRQALGSVNGARGAGSAARKPTADQIRLVNLHQLADGDAVRREQLFLALPLLLDT